MRVTQTTKVLGFLTLFGAMLGQAFSQGKAPELLTEYLPEDKVVKGNIIAVLPPEGIKEYVDKVKVASLAVEEQGKTIKKATLLLGSLTAIRGVCRPLKAGENRKGLAGKVRQCCSQQNLRMHPRLAVWVAQLESTGSTSAPGTDAPPGTGQGESIKAVTQATTVLIMMRVRCGSGCGDKGSVDGGGVSVHLALPAVSTTATSCCSRCVCGRAVS